MNMLSAPRIAGVAGGVGTTTVATALRAYDRGREGERGVDVLVCRSTGQSLHQAATIVAWLADNGRPRPVLAVTSDQPGTTHSTCKARLRMMEPRLAVVVLPYVGHWREMTDPLGEAALLSERPADELPKALRTYAHALASLAGLVLRSGLLGDPGFGPAPARESQSVRSTGGMRAVRGQTHGTRAHRTPTGGMRAIGAQPLTSQTGGTRAVGNIPATTSDDFLSVPLARFAVYGGAR